MTTISEMLSGRLVTVRPTATVAQAAQVLDQEHISHLLVVQDAELVGVLCTCDVGRAASSERVEQAMSHVPWTIECTMTPECAVARMLELSVSCLPVLDDGELIGIVTLSELARRGFAPDTVERCSACGSTEHVRCAEHGIAVGFCLECARRSEPPAWDDELGGGS
jgi:predicted transcriptional regulator